MGWHLFVLHATGPAATAATLTAAGYVATGLRLPAEEAVAEIDDLAPGGLALLDPAPSPAAGLPGSPGLQAVARALDDDALPLALSADGGEAATFLWQAAGGTHVLSVVRDGRPQRRLVRVDGEVVVDEGPALPAEATAGVDWSDPDAALRSIASAVTGDPIGSPAWLARPTRLRRRRRRLG